MQQNWVRLFVLGIAMAGSMLADDVIKIAPAQEAQLRERLNFFWEQFVAGKFRQADQVVSEDSKDEFFAWPKKRIKSFHVDHIFYADGGKAAKVVTTIESQAAILNVGSMDVKQPLESWWRLENGQWFWFKPKNETRQTPFGTMNTNESGGEAPLVPTGQFMRGPDIETLWKMVLPDRTEVVFVMGEAKTETITVKNGLPGSVNLTHDAPGSQELEFDLDPRIVPRGGSAILTIRYQPKGKPAKDAEAVLQVFHLGVAQTGKSFDIKVHINPKK
ncbi:hypothetical protein [Bryobacter aggregatus]|uniref:hypothetical protein n=1 Tax=Bryobacter aggregatus TaxID=360054 RepID=UPI0004E0DA42|nr:hypothetical protein [Bryobacter aggregatus]